MPPADPNGTPPQRAAKVPMATAAALGKSTTVMAALPDGAGLGRGAEAGERDLLRGEAAVREVRRLMQERIALINTGVYHKGDRVIRELDRHIAELQAAA